jgi:hypothetical protein
MELALASPPASGCTRCVAARLATYSPSAERRLKSWRSLVALFAPGLAFGLGLLWLASRGSGAWHWLARPAQWPWELWTIAGSGLLGTVAGGADWAWHRWVAKCAIGPAERRCELLAMAAGGGPLFVVMAAASLSARPAAWLLPAVVIVVATTVMICYDEFVFHRKRCRRLETLLHRGLVFGQGGAWLAWAHWCFVRGGLHAVA